MALVMDKWGAGRALRQHTRPATGPPCTRPGEARPGALVGHVPIVARSPVQVSKAGKNSGRVPP